MQFHFNGEWLVVARTIGDDDNLRGTAIGYYKRRYLAEQDAAEWRERRSDWQVWTVRRVDYY